MLLLEKERDVLKAQVDDLSKELAKHKKGLSVRAERKFCAEI